jgi:predicted PurR-regulated permease PerM
MADDEDGAGETPLTAPAPPETPPTGSGTGSAATDVAAEPVPDPNAPPPTPGPASPYGIPGRPMQNSGPFYYGFVFAAGALLAYYLLQLVGHLSQPLTLVGISAFLAMGLDPLVRLLQRRGLQRGQAVAVVFLLLVLAVSAFAAAVLPALITQITEFANSLPSTVDNLQKSELFRRLDEDYGVVSNASEEIRKRVTSGETVAQVFGGVLGAGRAVLSGFFSAVTVLVLTLYFLASLPHITDAAFRLVPASRRPRARALGDEIIRRIGGYVAGQVVVAFINGTLTFLILLVLGLPYPAVVAVLVFLLGLIPLVGATIGAVIVVLVGFTDSWQVALGLGIYYVVYQQIENYVIAPRVMARTVSVPGAIALIAALAGGSLLGILGALVAIPLAAGLLLIVQEVVLPRQERV